MKVQLKPNDIIFCGSDGKDLAFSKKSSGKERTINKDCDSFVKLVEMSNGEFNLISDSLLAMGNLTDDLSLLRISYLGNLD